MRLNPQIITGTYGDGVHDDTQVIHTALARVAETTAASGQQVPLAGLTGNTLLLPAGAYRISETLKIPAGLTLAGVGWNRPGSVRPFSGLAGSWIITDAETQQNPVAIEGDGAGVRNLAFAVDGQESVPVPGSYPSGPETVLPATVEVTGNSALVEDIFMLNPYGGIRIYGAAQITLRRIFGQPLQYGILIDRSIDTNYIDNIHFWAFWQQTNSKPDDERALYQLKYGRALDLYRCDNPNLSNIFAYGYDRGLSLSASPTPDPTQPGQPIPHKVHLVNADFDSTTSGVYIDAPGLVNADTGDPDLTYLQITNVTMQATQGGNPNPGFVVTERSKYAQIQASNLRICKSLSAAIDIKAPNAQFFGNNIDLERWSGAVALKVDDPTSKAYLGVGFSVPHAGNGQFAFAQTAPTP